MAKLSHSTSLLLLHFFFLLNLEIGTRGVHAHWSRAFKRPLQKSGGEEVEFRAEEIVIDEEASKVEGSEANRLFTQVVAVIRGGFPTSTYPVEEIIQTSRAKGVRLFGVYRMK